MKSIYVIQLYKTIFLIKMKNSINILYTGSHKSFSIHYKIRGKFLKHILTNLYCNKYNKIDMCHSGVQKIFHIENYTKDY